MKIKVEWLSEYPRSEVIGWRRDEGYLSFALGPLFVWATWGDKRPSEPDGDEQVWYRGWEAGYCYDRAYWTRDGYVAYLGGADLDALTLSDETWEGLLNQIDDREE